MPIDFRASQIQTNKIISSGSTGTSTGARLLVYPHVADDGTAPNQGYINQSVFKTGSIGTDIFLYVSGGIGERNVGGAQSITCFGGDVHISGNLTVNGTYPSGGGSGTNFFWSPSNPFIEASGSLAITGSGYFKKGLSGSLQQISPGVPYLLAGPNITIATNSLGQVSITGSAAGGGGSSFYRLEVLDYYSTNATADTTAGQVIFPANQFTGSIVLYGVIANSSATATGSVRLYNVTSGSYVDIGGIGNQYLSVSGTTPTIVSSVNLISASNFNSSSQAIYELQVSSSNGASYGFFGGFELRPSGSFTGVTYMTSSTYYTYVSGTWEDGGNKLATTSSVAIAGNLGTGYFANNVGSDVYFFVSGNNGGVSAGNGVSVFGGDVVISGVLYGGSPLKISGSLQQGYQNSATGQYSHAEGYQTVANNSYSHAEGQGTTAGGLQSHAEGYLSVANGQASHAEGYNTNASTQYAHAEGDSTTASGYGSHSEGGSNAASNQYSHAEGVSTTASGYGSHSEGHQTTAGGQWTHAEGFKTTTSANYTHAEGESTSASATGAHSEGVITVASGIYSHAEGGGTTASGAEAHAEGIYTLASGYAAHAEGYLTTGSVDYSHAEGYKTKTYATGSHAEGQDSTTFDGADYSHAEGLNSKTYGKYSHAEGFKTEAQGMYSHSEGANSIASGMHSHAEGGGGTASGVGSHAEGYQTKAYGDYSHSEGYQTEASGTYSHAGGYGTIASGSGQTVVGRYNKSGNDFSLFVVGDGKSSAIRGDIFVVNSGSNPGLGTVEITGSLTISGALSSSFNQFSGLRYYPTIVTDAVLTMGTYNVRIDEYIVAVSCSSGPKIYLPAAEFGRSFVVKDVSGSAGDPGGNIIVYTSTGEKIDGANSSTIAIDFGSAKFVYFGSGTGWGTI